MKTTNTLIEELEKHMSRGGTRDWKFDCKKTNHFFRLKLRIDRELEKLNKIEKIIL